MKAWPVSGSSRLVRMMIAMAFIWRLAAGCARSWRAIGGRPDMRLRIAATIALLLAGCGSRSADQQATGNTPAAGQAASTAPAGGSGGLNIQPGEWEITMEMQAAEVSGMPAGVHMPQIPPTTTRSCLTPAQVGRANANFLTRSGDARAN